MKYGKYHCKYSYFGCNILEKIHHVTQIIDTIRYKIFIFLIIGPKMGILINNIDAKLVWLLNNENIDILCALCTLGHKGQVH
jgi:hypothetical protein